MCTWAPGIAAAPLTLLPTQGLYQWIYRTHEDAQEAREAAGEDPSGEGAREEDQLNSGNGTGRPRDRDARGDRVLCVHIPPSPVQSFSMLSALYESLIAAVTKYWEPGGLKPHTFAVLQFWRTQVQKASP